ncbi:tRNA 5-methylaminomethyl-2-thiouridinebiosynthesis bifunctional protein MnmC [Striga asiatica]|uniref:tRNA 5-methylaminomethyl-2-thiouridinebiosynthesis bifunctional protein MnmC n=1 Tax=Striga asiatica TaxID=4170 RepID=A0A5A7P2E4_STRAF|nr:tRNA 5-methylaminomethyl-2-thiouridinebiosynthesis bifunctional protein MnmC [Striga asiatica]
MAKPTSLLQEVSVRGWQSSFALKLGHVLDGGCDRGSKTPHSGTNDEFDGLKRNLRAAHREHFSPVDETTGDGPAYEQHRAGEPFEMPQVSAAPGRGKSRSAAALASAIDLQPSSPSQPRRNDRTLTGRQNATSPTPPQIAAP